MGILSKLLKIQVDLKAPKGNTTVSANTNIETVRIY